MYVCMYVYVYIYIYIYIVSPLLSGRAARSQAAVGDFSTKIFRVEFGFCILLLLLLLLDNSASWRYHLVTN